MKTNVAVQSTGTLIYVLKKKRRKEEEKYILPYQFSEISINKAEHKVISKLYMFTCKLRRDFGLGLGFDIGRSLVGWGFFWGRSGGVFWVGLFLSFPPV